MANVREDVDEIIKIYFELGLKYKHIPYILLQRHGISISERHIKRKLRNFGFSRRNEWTNIDRVISFVQSEICSSGQLHGYRWMHSKCLRNGIIAKKEDIRLILSIVDPEACHLRSTGRLTRRAYYAKGPNFIWHMDSYDKLKPFGFCVNGCIDGFSRSMIWLCVYHNNSNPRIIGGYYISAVEKARGCPKLVRGDLGTENGHVKEFQHFLHRDRHTGELCGDAYIAGTSTHNQRIEQWWGHLRKECAEFWMSIFKGLRDDGLYILQFCFMAMIQVT